MTIKSINNTLRQVFFLIIVLKATHFIKAQNPILTYDFAYTPQAMLNNPSYDVNKKWHVAFPVLNHSIWGSSSGVVLHDIFADNKVPFSEKIKVAAAKMTDKDVFLANQKIDILNIGFSLDTDNYLSFGFYEELDAFSSFPKEMSDLFFNGNVIGKSYSIDKFNFQADLLGVYHIGWQKKMDNASLGLRFKLYSGAYNITSTRNSGAITTVEGEKNIYKHILSEVNAKVNASGISKDGIDNEDPAKVINKLLLSGNKGVGIDLGYSKQITDDWYFSTSLTDIGVMFNSHEVYNYKAKGAFETEGIGLAYDGTVHDYWEALKTEFKDKIEHQTTNDDYMTWRPMKFNLFTKYTFAGSTSFRSVGSSSGCGYSGKSNRKTTSSKHALGGLFHLEKRNDYLLPYGSIFYEGNFNEKAFIRLAYSANKFSDTNVGLSLGLNFKYVNFYAGVNNIIGLLDVARANEASATFGLNIGLGN